MEKKPAVNFSNIKIKSILLLKQKYIQIQTELQGTHNRGLNEGRQNTKPKPKKWDTEKVQ